MDGLFIHRRLCMNGRLRINGRLLLHKIILRLCRFIILNHLLWQLLTADDTILCAYGVFVTAKFTFNSHSLTLLSLDSAAAVAACKLFNLRNAYAVIVTLN